MTILPRLITLALLTLGLAACTTIETAPVPALDEIPRQIPPAETDLSAWQVPPTLGSFHFQGEVSLDDQPLRLLRYRNSDDTLLDLVLFPFPGGWDTMTPGRAVAGQYGQQRQDMIERALRHGAQEVLPLMETLAGEASLNYPMARGRLLQHYSSRTLVTLMALTAVPPVFISGHITGPADQADPLDEILHQAVIDFADANASAGEQVTQQQGQ